MDIKDKQKLNMIRQQLVLKQSGLWVYTYNDSNRAPESLIKNGFKLYKLNETAVKD